jgi:hypothetical protein
MLALPGSHFPLPGAMEQCSQCCSQCSIARLSDARRVRRLGGDRRRLHPDYPASCPAARCDNSVRAHCDNRLRRAQRVAARSGEKPAKTGTDRSTPDMPRLRRCKPGDCKGLVGVRPNAAESRNDPNPRLCFLKRRQLGHRRPIESSLAAHPPYLQAGRVRRTGPSRKLPETARQPRIVRLPHHSSRTVPLPVVA